MSGSTSNTINTVLFEEDNITLSYSCGKYIGIVGGDVVCCDYSVHNVLSILNTHSKHREYKAVRISELQVGDTIMHHGVLRTVSRCDLRSNSFYGDTVFGDSYMLGHKPVIKVRLIKAS